MMVGVLACLFGGALGLSVVVKWLPMACPGLNGAAAG